MTTPNQTMLRWPDVQKRLKISRSTYDRGVIAGIYPKPIKLGPPPTRAVGWLESDIDRLLASLASQARGEEDTTQNK